MEGKISGLEEELREANRMLAILDVIDKGQKGRG
jgi:hypothetical protein